MGAAAHSRCPGHETTADRHGGASWTTAPTDLVAVVWPGQEAFGRNAKNVETPASRLRSKLGLPIPPRRGEGFYKLDIPRAEVDALDFIDRARRDDVEHGELDKLLGMWQATRRVLHGDLPDVEWNQLNRAVGHLLGRLSKLSSHELGELEHFRAFAQRLSLRRPATCLRNWLFAADGNPVII
jgi:hypothetical protein